MFRDKNYLNSTLLEMQFEAAQIHSKLLCSCSQCSMNNSAFFLYFYWLFKRREDSYWLIPFLEHFFCSSDIMETPDTVIFAFKMLLSHLKYI
jgi:hypothetical protein